MSSYRYKKTQGEDDGDPLTLNEPGIELNTFSAIEPVSTEVNTEEPTSNEVRVNSRVKKLCRMKTFYLIWAFVTTLLLFGIIILAAVAHSSIRHVKWCCHTEEEYSKCRDMALFFDVEALRPQMDCILMRKFEECVAAIDTDQVDVMSVGAIDLMNNRNKLKPIMSEEVYEYNSTKAVFGDYFVRSKIAGRSMDPKNCSSESSSYCIDQETERRSPLIYLTAMTSLTQVGRCSKSVKIKSDLLSALECPAAFTSTAALKSLAASGAVGDPRNILLICDNGRTQQLSEHLNCTKLFVPTRSLVISNKLRSGSDYDMPFLIIELFHTAYLYFGRESSTFKMFDSARYDRTDLMFTDRTLKLVPLMPNCTADAYLGKTFLSFHGVEALNGKVEGTCFLPAFMRPEVY